MLRVRSLLRKPRARLVATLVVLVLVGVYAGAVVAAPPLADTLTVSARLQEQFCDSVGCWVPPHNKTTPRLVFVKVIYDDATIAAVRDAINGIPRPVLPGPVSLFSNGVCSNLAANGLYYYDFRFSRLGVPLQDVTVDSWCPWWHINTLGVPNVFERFGDGAIVTIAHVTGMPTIPGP